MKFLVKKIYAIIKRILIILRYAPFLRTISNASCYYPNKIRKNAVARYFDNIAWLVKKGEKNLFYTQYGLDIRGSKSADYIGFREFMNLRNRYNQISRLDISVGILRDKFLFYKYMKANDLNVPEVFALQRNGTLFDVFFKTLESSEIEKEEDYFVKDASGECASFVKHIKNYKHLQSILPQMPNGNFIFQRKIIQHPEMNRLNPNAVNTIRIVTINDNGKPYLFASLLRIGTQKSGCADNTSAGGIAVGIHSDGKLYEKGILKPLYGTTLSAHPDTQVLFKEFQIPFYKEAVQLVCRAHVFFYSVKAIGWDVAISDKGPVIIEGNDNWEITSIQAIFGGKKKELYNLMAS